MTFYPIAIELDGRRYRGDWCLMQGGRLCVRSPFGSRAAEVGSARPEVVAKRTLAKIVHDDQKLRAQGARNQERELARLRKRNAKSPPA